MRFFRLIFIPINDKAPLHDDFAAVEDSDHLKGEIERLAMRYEERYNIPYRCISVQEIKKEEHERDLS